MIITDLATLKKAVRTLTLNNAKTFTHNEWKRLSKLDKFNYTYIFERTIKQEATVREMEDLQLIITRTKEQLKQEQQS